jgi:hypothetical protein
MILPNHDSEANRTISHSTRLLRRNKIAAPDIRRKVKVALRRKTLPNNCQAQDVSK